MFTVWEIHKLYEAVGEAIEGARRDAEVLSELNEPEEDIGALEAKAAIYEALHTKLETLREDQRT